MGDAPIWAQIPNFHVWWDPQRNVITGNNFIQIGKGVCELQGSENWGLPLTWLVALTTVQHYHADCDDFQWSCSISTWCHCCTEHHNDMLEYCYSEHQDIQKLHTLRMSRPSSTVCLNGPISTSRISSFCKHSIQLQRLSHCDTRRLWATVKPSLCKSRKPVSVAEKYGDGFAHLDDINQYFAGIATDPNYDPDELSHLRRVAEDNSEHLPAT